MKEVIINPVRKLHSSNYRNNEFTSAVASAFWLFNLLYGLGVSLIAGPMMIERLWPAISQGNAPMHHLAVIVAAIMVPVVACSFVYLSGLTREDSRLAEFLVGVELPIAGVLIGRSLWAHELTVTSLTLYGFMLCIAACQCWLLTRRKLSGMPLNRAPGLSMTAASAFVAIGGVYLSTLALVFTSPVTVGLFILGVYITGSGLLYTIIYPLALLAVPMGVVVLILAFNALRAALYLPYCYISQWQTRLERNTENSHRAVSAAVMIACVTAFLILHYQARAHSLSALSDSENTEAQQIELLEKSESLRAEMLDAYLAPLRYLPRNFGFSTRQPLLQARNTVLAYLLPGLVYQGNINRDHTQADQHYESFFDAPIQRAERDAILTAHRNHWTPNRQPSADLLQIGQRTVHVESQNLTVKVDQGVATVTVQEVLRNRTSRSLETFQYFTLPEDAVVTGLWLSDTESNPEMFAFQVSPRGAAQQVYKEQVQMRVDPALLEMVGPRQYRLRVFPVLPNTPMVVTMTYKTLPDVHGNWPLPVLLEQRNIFWDSHTRRKLNGNTITAKQESSWLPQQLAPSSEDHSPAHLGYVNGGSYVYAKPLPVPHPPGTDNRIAVLIDGSHSMGSLRIEVHSALQNLSMADLYFCKTACTPTNIESSNKWVFFGNSQPLQQLASLKAVTGKSRYHSIIILSDGGSYEIPGNEKMPHIETPTWLVEMGQGAHAYHDNLTDYIQGSGGAIVRSVNQALVQMQIDAGSNINPAKAGDTVVAVTSQHVWYKRQHTEDDKNNPYLSEISAGLQIKQPGQRNGSPDALDELHDIAIRHGIVSAYSSMIVLVNDNQRQRLAELETHSDRFKREVETGKRQMRRVANAVPEPHEWALMGIGLLLLLVTAHRQGWTQQLVTCLQPDRHLPSRFGQPQG